MKQYMNKKCKMHILRGGRDLYYEATVTTVSDTHISFIDKFDIPYTFRIDDVIEIRGV